MYTTNKHLIVGSVGEKRKRKISSILTGRRSKVPSMCFCEKDRPVGYMLHNLINVSLNLLLFLLGAKVGNKRSESGSHLANDCISD